MTTGNPDRDAYSKELRDVRRRARVTRNDALLQQQRAWLQRMAALELQFKLRDPPEPPEPTDTGD